MFVPECMTEDEVLVDIEKVVKELAASFKFGYYEVEDMEQEARRFAIIALPKYKPELDESGRPTRLLAGFLYAHVRNRLINLRRDKYKRTDPPCQICDSGREYEHEDGEVCKKYKLWKKRNTTKANLTRPLTLDGSSEDFEPNIAINDGSEKTVYSNELKLIIDRELPAQYRSDYLRMLVGEKIPQSRRKQVEVAILNIISLHKEI